MVKQFLAPLIVLYLLSTGGVHAEAADQKGLTVSAAISLKNAFTDIGKAFEAANEGVKVAFNFGASGDLMTQIRGGAPVDVFASAAQKDMDTLDNDGFVIKDTRLNFVANSVVLIKPAASKIALFSFEDLKNGAVEKIAVGSPASVPAGRYADEVLRSLKLSDAVKDKLVFAENVRQVLDYVARNEVDAGVVYATDAATRPREVAIVVAAPEGSHKPILYPIAVVKGSKNERAGRGFVAFVRSAAGKKILERYGFRAVP